MKQMREFELWIDESEDFKDDDIKKRKGFTPSCIGGAIIEKGAIGANLLRKWYPQEVHCSEKRITPEEQVEYFKQIQQIKELKNFIIVNEETIKFEYDKDLYLFMLAEGIIRAMKRLKAQYGQIHLTLIIATHVKGYVKKTYQEFLDDEKTLDIENLRTHLKVSGYRDGGIREEEWDVIASKPKDNERLQVADIICNTYLKRNTALREKAAELNQYFNDANKTWKFSLVGNKGESIFYDNMSRGEIGEAVLGLCKEEEKCIENTLNTIKERFVSIEPNLLKLHIDYMISKVQLYINDKAPDKDFNMCVRLISNIKNYFIPLLVEAKREDLQEFIDDFEFDLDFLLITVYTHMGNYRKTQELIEKCEGKTAKMKHSWSNVEKILKFQNRKVVHMINCFDFKAAEEEIENNLPKYKEISELMGIVIEETVGYEEYAKYLGTSVQVEQALIRQDKSKYEKAVELSDLSIENFSTENDKKRQYQYRALLEMDYGNYDLALAYIRKAIDSNSSITLEDFIQNANVGPQNAYIWSHIIRLIAEGFLGEWETSNNYFDLINQHNIVKELEKIKTDEHPYEIIMWKYATCWSQKGRENIKAACNYYDEAIRISFSDENYTLWIIGFAILLEKYAYLLKLDVDKKSECKRELKKRFKKIQESDMIESMKYFWGENIDFDNPEWEYFYEMSRLVTY